MTLPKSFFDKLIQKYSTLYKVEIYITDESAKIISSTDHSKYNTFSKTALYTLNSNKSLIINSNQEMASIMENSDTLLYCSPILYLNHAIGSIIIKGQLDDIQLVGNSIKTATEALLEYEEFRQVENNIELKDKVFLKNLFSENPDKERISSILKSKSLDRILLFCVIYLQIESKENKYFNNNLSLGYTSSSEKSKKEIVNKIKNNRYLTSRDILIFYSDKEIVILKSFLPVHDFSKVYIALDNICNTILEDLTSYNLYDFKISYGNIYSTIYDAKNSFQEAKEIISIGQIVSKNENFFRLEDFMFENVCHYLHPQIVNKLIIPTIKKLKKKDGTLDYQLIKITEEFVDQCMSFSKTSKKIFLHRNTINANLEKYKLLTGLNPVNNFHDAFLVKMIAIYVRYHYDIKN